MTAGPSVRRSRLDRELVRRGLAVSCEQASALIEQGLVTVAGATATKAATGVTANTPVLVAADQPVTRYVSRGGYKLAAGLDRFAAGSPPLVVAGCRALDAGASTGGFTDVLLRRGARPVVAVDVGYGQLAWSLRTDPRVLLHERVNVRALSPERIGGAVDLCVADLSFIGLGAVLPTLAACTRPDGDLVVLVKPQFEVGRRRLGAGGVVREAQLRTAAVHQVALRASELGLQVRDALASPLPGPRGNVEYLLWLSGRHGAPGCPPAELATLAAATVAAGPS